MHCEIARERILEADTAELAREDATDLAGHLDGCDGCRALADEVLESGLALAGALSAMEPGLDVELALARVPSGRGWSLVQGWGRVGAGEKRLVETVERVFIKSAGVVAIANDIQRHRR